ncbi:MAG: ATP-binding protein [Gammaproteobacteria bacterium]|nr:ATP-binding protein [Gammaproteobacteria bacterium]
MSNPKTNEHNIHLHAERERFLHALQMVKLGYWHWDLTSQELTWSAETFYFLGLDPDKDQADMQAFINSLHPDDRERVEKNNQAVMTTGKAPDMEYRIVRPSGEIIHLYTRAEMIYDAEHNPIALFGTLQDISEQKKQQIALKQTQIRLESALVAKNEFLSMMSHELNTPMNAILGFAQILHAELKDETLLDFSTEILDASQQLNQAFGDILRYVELDKSQPEISDIDLTDFLHYLLHNHQTAADDKSIRLVLSMPADELAGFCSDERMLGEIFKQLLSNAINYSFPGGAVTITPRQMHNGRMKFTIADTGIGIPTHQHESIFIPFERLPTNHNISEVRGTGIGLTIARKLARTLGGDIQLLTDTGPGTIFEINLPKVECQTVSRFTSPPTN